MKKEFDIHRAKNTAHPLLARYGVDAKPAEHEKLDIWRSNFKGVEFLDEGTNFLVTGAIDDLWINSKGEFIVVDYKATSKFEAVIELDQKWHDGYKRQMEVYQWLIRQNGHKVSSVGYFVYANGKKDREAFDAKLEFDLTLIPYEGKTEWIAPTLTKIKKCLDGSFPKPSETCEYCAWQKAITRALEV